MTLGRVVGRVVATRHDPGLDRHRLLLVQPLAADGRSRGAPRVMLDAVGAGAGEVVFFVRGKEAAFPFRPDHVPADATVAGIVDHYQVEGRDVSGVTDVSGEPPT